MTPDRLESVQAPSVRGNEATREIVAVHDPLCHRHESETLAGNRVRTSERVYIIVSAACGEDTFETVEIMHLTVVFEPSEAGTIDKADEIDDVSIRIERKGTYLRQCDPGVRSRNAFTFSEK